MNKKISLILKLIIGITLLFTLLYSIGIKKVISSLIEMNIYYIPIIALISLSILSINAINIRMMATPFTRSISLKTMFRYSILSWVMGLVTPGKVGEYSMVYFLKKEKLSIGQGTALLLVDKTVSLSIMIVLSLLAWFKFFNNRDPLIIILPIAILLIGISVIFYSKFGRKIIKKYILRSAAVNFEGFSKALNLYLIKKPYLIIANFILTLIRLAIAGFGILAFFSAYGLTNKMIDAILIYNLTAILSLVPITLNGLGITESLSVFMYGLLGFDKILIAGIFISMLIYNYIFASLVFLFLSIKKEK